MHFSPFITFQIQLLQQCPQCQKQSSHRGQEGTQQKPKNIEFKMQVFKLTRIKRDVKIIWSFPRTSFTVTSRSPITIPPFSAALPGFTRLTSDNKDLAMETNDEWFHHYFIKTHKRWKIKYFLWTLWWQGPPIKDCPSPKPPFSSKPHSSKTFLRKKLPSKNFSKKKKEINVSQRQKKKPKQIENNKTMEIFSKYGNIHQRRPWGKLAAK